MSPTLTVPSSRFRNMRRVLLTIWWRLDTGFLLVLRFLKDDFAAHRGDGAYGHSLTIRSNSERRISHRRDLSTTSMTTSMSTTITPLPITCRAAVIPLTIALTHYICLQCRDLSFWKGLIGFLDSRPSFMRLWETDSARHVYLAVSVLLLNSGEITTVCRELEG